MKRLVWMLMFVFAFSCFPTRPSFAGEIDLLLQKLVEKGVLTAGEASEIAVETKEEIKKEIAQAKHETLPKWLQTFKLKGDARVRYQYETRKGSNLNLGQTTERDRGRIRLRLGAEAKVNDQAKVHVGLASGGTDPRSTNQTFENSFELKDIRLDYEYAEWMPLGWATLLGGRMKNPLWEPGDMLWDTDINPEGGALKLQKQLLPKLSGYLTTGVFMMDENANGSDPWVYVFQPGMKLQLLDTVALNMACSYYNFNQVQGQIPDHSQSSNNRKRGGLEFGYDSVSPALELAINEPLKPLGLSFIDIPHLALFAEYVHNLEAPYSKSGYLGGVRFGHEKVSDWGQWQAKYQYVMLGTQAWLDTLPDSDRYGGRTGVRSHEIVLSYGLNKNMTFDVDYYCNQLTNNPSDAAAGFLKTEHLIQADLNFKF